MQKELAVTPAKNATKPNPFKIIPLSPTGKQNGLGDRRNFEKAAVTVLTDGPNYPTLDDDVTLIRSKFILRVSDTRFSRSTLN
jgi:hypothetical protein